MYLLVYLLIFLGIGYLLARWEANRQPDLSQRLRSWATRQGAEYFPRDFREWLTGLSSHEAQDFTQALQAYSQGLGFDLERLVDDGYATDPRMRTVFVEAVVVYSQAYRKARLVRQRNQPRQAQPVKDSKPAEPASPAGQPASQRLTEEVETPVPAS